MTVSSETQLPKPFRNLCLVTPKCLNAHLKAHTTDLNELEQESREAFKAATDSEWKSEIKAEYKEKIDAVKEEWGGPERRGYPRVDWGE